MGELSREATLSADGVFRYTLGRRWSDGPRRVVFLMLNPSTADANIDDPTIRKCVGFAKRWGYDALTVVNLFAFRATKPADLKRCGFQVGPENLFHITRSAEEAERVVLAWGANANPHDIWAARVVSELQRACVKLSCLGLCGNGSPRHPLMLAYETPLEPWEVSNG
jgi:hypothetical protein